MDELEKKQRRDITQFTFNLLKEQATKRSPTIYYSDLASKIYDKHEVYYEPYGNDMADLLDDINLNCFNSGKPLITVLVIKKDNKMPGGGFYKLAARLYEDDSLLDDWDRCFAEEMRKVTEYYQQNK